MHTDLAVYTKEYPELRLVAEIKPGFASPAEQDGAVKQIGRYMWGANCHYGLILTPTKTYVLRDDFASAGPEAIRVSDILPTAALLGRLGRSVEGISGREFEELARDWLERLAASYETALPDDPDIMRAFFPDIVGAVAEGRVVAEVAA